MAMPDGSGSAQKHRLQQDSGGGRRRAVAFCVVALGVTGPALATDRVLAWWGWVLLGLGGVVGGIVGIHAMDDALAGFLDLLGRRWNQPDFRCRLRTPLLWILVAVVSLPAGMGLAAFAEWVRYVTGECPLTVPAKVLTTPTMSGTVERLATAFQTSTADSRGCPRHSVFVMTLSEEQARTALGNGWRDDADPDSSDVARYGPRPDAYLPDSLLALANLDEVRSRVVQDARIYASAPVVLALSPAAARKTQAEGLSGQNLSDQIKELSGAGIPVIRPAPELSQASVLAHYVYSPGSVSGTLSEESSDFEKTMLDGAKEAQYPDSGEKALLQRFSDPDRAKKPVALLMTAPFAKHPELLLGENTGAETQLKTIPLAGSGGTNRPEVSFPFLTLSLETESGRSGDRSRCKASDPADRPSSCAAWKFREWLGTEDGRRTLRGLDLNPCSDSSCTDDPQAGSAREKAVLDMTKYARKVHEQNRLPRRVLVMMDASQSMGPRFRQVATMIGTDLPRLLSKGDQLGLHLVGGSLKVKGTRPRVPFGPVGGEENSSTTVVELRAALEGWESGGGSPMAGPLAEALNDLSSSSSFQGVLLLVTDGSFALHLDDSEIQIKKLATLARESQVRVLALVTGTSACSEKLRRIVETDSTSDTCSAVQGAVTSELDELLGGQ
ncbi:MAG: Ca-activated chloride channel [Actinomycetota bacterium]|nr:Ca-activated chloride channel [Actinomycetota bacterium]MDQ1294667.1 Ca-activated chloride channel [Actinomycetota bacterium]